MIILKGKTESELTEQAFSEMKARFACVTVDLGTGDGRNVYRKAKANPDTLFIGVDPAKDNMTEIAVKLCKKPAKGGLDNVLLVPATAEALPDMLSGAAQNVTVLFPWGTLLEGIVKPVGAILDAVTKAAEDGAGFEFITTYSDRCEENTIESRGLPTLSTDYFNGPYRDELLAHGLVVENVELLDNEYVKNFDSLWAKRLAFGRKRDFYRITGTVRKS